MEHTNATWKDYSTHIIHKDVFFHVSSILMKEKEKTKAILATLGRQMETFEQNYKTTG